MSTLPAKVFDLILLGVVGLLVAVVTYLIVHYDAYLRSPSEVAAVVAVVALAAALIATLRTWAPVDHERVLALAPDLGLPTIDMRSDFRRHGNPLSLFPYEEGRHLVKTQRLHYNAQGHRLVANRILDALQSVKLVTNPDRRDKSLASR